EDIKDDAVRCRWCTSDLTARPDQVLARPPVSVQQAVGGGPGGSAGPSEARAPERAPEPVRAGVSGESPPTPQPQPPPSPTPSPTPQPQPPQPQPPQAEPQPTERTKV